MMYCTYFTQALFQGFETIGLILILRKQIHSFVFIFSFFFDVFKICQLVLKLRGLTFCRTDKQKSGRLKSRQ